MSRWHFQGKPSTDVSAAFRSAWLNSRETLYGRVLGSALAKKLGIAEKSNVVLIGAPDNYLSLLGNLPAEVHIGSRLSGATDMVHVFSARRADLQRLLMHYRNKLKPTARVWVSWPKKSSKVTTDITEDAIRELALPLGFVDVKVCAINDTWSGLKLVVRKHLR